LAKAIEGRVQRIAASEDPDFPAIRLQALGERSAVDCLQHHERAGHRTRATNLAAMAEKVVLATSQRSPLRW
jgi:hypothetical protein